MIKALSTASTGMHAQETRLDQIASDLANLNTTGYKRGKADFQDLLYQNLKESGGGPNQNPVGVQVGSGARVAAQYAVFDQGPVKQTNGMLDFLINGDGFFVVQRPTGEISYTRDGSFKLDNQGRVVTTDGHPMIPNIVVPQGASGLMVSPQGEVKAVTPPSTEQVIGQIQIVNFINPEGLRKIGNNQVVATTASGPPVQGNPGENGLGLIMQGALEGSNVKPTESIMDMIATQRTYESNAKIMGVADQMWSTTNNIGNR
ncbi:MAG: flagellar basal-body rod protein FlgG [Bacteriovoracia bacterium]